MCILTEINDKLDDLQTGDPFLPPDANATCRLKVVPVHDHVHHEIETNDGPRHGCQANELSVAQNGRCAMMVAVQECFTALVGGE